MADDVDMATGAAVDAGAGTSNEAGLPTPGSRPPSALAASGAPATDGAAPFSLSRSFDEERYNRQLYVMGHEAQLRMGESSVLIVGLGGLGLEIAKNVILMGVQHVTLYDPTPLKHSDLASHFYGSEADVGKSLAEVSVTPLSHLNEYVRVSVLDSAELSPAVVSTFTVVVMCNAPLSLQTVVDDACRASGVKFVSCTLHGVFSNIFCDFGSGFNVSDATGEPPASFLIEGITKEQNATVKVRDDKPHGLQTGDVVQFKEIDGMVELNDGTPRQITVTGRYTFTIGNTSHFSPYVGGGFVTAVPHGVVFDFVSLRDSLPNPEIQVADFGKEELARQIHLVFQAIDQYTAAHGHAPVARNPQARAEVLKLASSTPYEGKVPEITDKLVLQVCHCIGAQLGPMAAAIGGIAAQEVVKACSLKFTPIKQWLYFDALEALPDDLTNEAEFAISKPSRYDAQIACFGHSVQQKLLEQRYFLVGAGAIGCEMLKNWAMMGVGASTTGGITVTDMDRIEKSNLARQFLFRNTDIGQPKSVTAARAATVMNPDMQVTAMETAVAAETVDVFDSKFWSSQSGVCTALDNVKARLFVDGQCVFYRKPLLESGTLGTKGNTQIVVPHITENYGASMDPPEESIPICTLKNFPNRIEHTLQWAVDWFAGSMQQAPEVTNAFIANPAYVDQLRRDPTNAAGTLDKIVDCLVANRPYTVQDCVTWARQQFENLFVNELLQLLHNFPRDAVTTGGTPFWSGPKRAPDPAVFSIDDPTHMVFIVTATRLRGAMYGIKAPTNPAEYRALLSNVTVEPFVPKSGVKIATDEKAAATEQSAASGTIDIDSLISRLPAHSSLAGLRLNPAPFDKDDDLHMSLVTAVSNLRARNYRITEASKHESRRIAGKIIPAIATTTAMVAGTICLELYKILQNKPLEAYRNAYANLAVSIFSLSEPVGCAKRTVNITDSKGQAKEWQWSLWDSIDIHEQLTLQQFLDYFQSNYGLAVSMLSYGSSLVYCSFYNPAKQAEKLKMLLQEAIRHTLQKDLDSTLEFLQIELCCSNDEGEDVDLPSIRYYL